MLATLLFHADGNRFKLAVMELDQLEIDAKAWGSADRSIVSASCFGARNAFNTRVFQKRMHPGWKDCLALLLRSNPVELQHSRLGSSKKS